VLDETGEFCANRCNKAGVDLEPLEQSNDIAAVRNLIDRHVQFTGSPRGKWVLENWGDMVTKFVKVFPHEYKRVLGVARSAQQYQVPLAGVTMQREQVANG